jgi:hypothetical protein
MGVFSMHDGNSQREAMARPAPNPPQGDNDYGNDDERDIERLGGSPAKRPAPTPARPARQSQTQHQSGALPEHEPQDVPWEELEPPARGGDDIAATPRQEPRARPERQSRAENARRDPLPASAPVPEPVIPAPHLEDPTWGAAEETEPDAIAESAASPKPQKVAKRGKFDIAGTIYLILLALLAASLSAAVVLVLF